jgi:hypothetical protein
LHHCLFTKYARLNVVELCQAVVAHCSSASILMHVGISQLPIAIESKLLPKRGPVNWVAPGQEREHMGIVGRGWGKICDPPLPMLSNSDFPLRPRNPVPGTGASLWRTHTRLGKKWLHSHCILLACQQIRNKFFWVPFN